VADVCDMIGNYQVVQRMAGDGGIGCKHKARVAHCLMARLSQNVGERQ
jgi:hypothetical protein